MRTAFSRWLRRRRIHGKVGHIPIREGCAACPCSPDRVHAAWEPCLNQARARMFMEEGLMPLDPIDFPEHPDYPTWAEDHPRAGVRD
jgi:hypothetical protein